MLFAILHLVFYMNSFPFVAFPAFAILYLTFGIFYFVSIVFNDPLVVSPVLGVFLYLSVGSPNANLDENKEQVYSRWK